MLTIKADLLYSLIWHIGEPDPVSGNPRVVTFIADGDELKYASGLHSRCIFRPQD